MFSSEMDVFCRRWQNEIFLGYQPIADCIQIYNLFLLLEKMLND